MNARPLLDWVLRRHPDTPKARAKQWILAGRVCVQGQVIRQPHRLIPDPGERLELRARSATSLDCGAGWQIHPRVALLYLDSALAVVDKGPGLLSLPVSEDDLSAMSILGDFLAGNLKARHRYPGGRPLPAPYRVLPLLPVHRLDKYTSGVFCMATNPAARQHLIEQLNAHTMRREYVAFVEGRPAAPKGVWRHWLQPSQDELRQQVVSEARAGAPDSEGREAITRYEVITEYLVAGGACVVSKLRLRLETGRKHQIRVQAAHAGLPLLGDRTYNPAVRGPGSSSCIQFSRQALHAETLSLEHPDRAGTRMSWTAALPKDLRQLEDDLRAGCC